MQKISLSLICCVALAACAAEKHIEVKTPAPISYTELTKTPSKATLELQSINPELAPKLIQVGDNVHVAIGYGASVFSFIESDDSIIMVDTGQMVETSKEALAVYREISQKPISTIILTHSHGDHVNGAAAFMEQDTAPEVWALDNYGIETSAFHASGITINRKRGVRQAGFKLPPEERINNGIAPAVYPPKGAFNPANAVKPTKNITSPTSLKIGGVNLKLVPANGETADQIYILHENSNVLFAGDNFYQSWPNLYAIRGTPYRDVIAWSDSIEAIRKVGADTLVGGHTLPIIGAENVDKTLNTYRDGINYIFDKTIEGINKGLSPDDLVDYARLPPELEQARVLRPFYGNPDWAVRSIFTGYLGWYDGNPTNLFPLPPKDEAAKMIALVGGMAKMMETIVSAEASKDDQWAAQLADHVLAVEPNNETALIVKANSLTRLAEKNTTATARNYYLTMAQELRDKAKSK